MASLPHSDAPVTPRRLLPLVVLACLGVPLDADIVAMSLLTWARWLWKKASL